MFQKQAKTIRQYLLLAVLFFQLGHAQKQPWIKYEYQSAEDAESALAPQKGNDGAYALNLKGIYHHLTGQPDSAVTTYTLALKQTKDNNSTISILLNRALAYNQVGNLGPALQDCNKALKLNNGKNPLYDAFAWRIMGNAYLYKDDVQKAITYIEKAIALLEKYNHKQYVYDVKAELGNVYMVTNNYDVAEGLYKNYLDNNPNTKSRVFISVLLNYAEVLIELKKADQARAILLKYLPDAQASKDKEITGALYSRLGNVEKSVGNNAAALQYYEKACSILFEAESKHLILILGDYLKLQDNKTNYDKAVTMALRFKQSPMYRRSSTQARFEFERAVAGLYKKAGMQNEAYDALNTSLTLCDSLRQVNNGEDMYGALAKYRTEIEEQKNQNLKQELEDEKKIQMLIWALLVVFLIGKVFLVRAIWLRNKLSKQKLKTVEAQAALLTEKEEQQREKAESEKAAAEEKQREMVSMALKLAKYNDSLQNIVSQVDDKKIATAAEVKSEINKVVAEDDFWSYFDLRFTGLYPDFKAKIAQRYPSLSKSEVDFCCLVKLNLSNKEIGSLLYISYESVISKRYRIRKKMELKEDDDLNAILEDIG